jgi:hypothetical protein
MAPPQHPAVPPASRPAIPTATLLRTLHGGKEVFLSSEHWHLFPVVQPRPDVTVPRLLPAHRCCSLRNNLHTPEYR